MGSGGIAACILKLCTRYRWVGSFTLRPLYTPEPLWTMYWREKIPTPVGKRNPVGQPVAYSLY